jgi:hypothetical protein
MSDIPVTGTIDRVSTSNYRLGPDGELYARCDFVNNDGSYAGSYWQKIPRLTEEDLK